MTILLTDIAESLLHASVLLFIAWTSEFISHGSSIIAISEVSAIVSVIPITPFGWGSRVVVVSFITSSVVVFSTTTTTTSVGVHVALLGLSRVATVFDLVSQVSVATSTIVASISVIRGSSTAISVS